MMRVQPRPRHPPSCPSYPAGFPRHRHRHNVARPAVRYGARLFHVPSRDACAPLALSSAGCDAALRFLLLVMTALRFARIVCVPVFCRAPGCCTARATPPLGVGAVLVRLTSTTSIRPTRPASPRLTTALRVPAATSPGMLAGLHHAPQPLRRPRVLGKARLDCMFGMF